MSYNIQMQGTGALSPIGPAYGYMWKIKRFAWNITGTDTDDSSISLAVVIGNTTLFGDISGFTSNQIKVGIAGGSTTSTSLSDSGIMDGYSGANPILEEKMILSNLDTVEVDVVNNGSIEWALEVEESLEAGE